MDHPMTLQRRSQTLTQEPNVVHGVILFGPQINTKSLLELAR